MDSTIQYIDNLLTEHHDLFNKLGCDKPKFIEFVSETKDIVSAFSGLYDLTLLMINYHIYEKDEKICIDPIYRFNDPVGEYNLEGIQSSLDYCLQQKDYI